MHWKAAGEEAQQMRPPTPWPARWIAPPLPDHTHPCTPPDVCEQHMSTTLVTGGAGFIGSHLIEQLLSTTADEVICVDNLDGFYDTELKRANVARWLSDRRVRFVEHDLADVATMRALIRRH